MRFCGAHLDTAEAGLMSGMLFGSSFMGRRAAQRLPDRRAAHILAVSGLHVGILYALVMFILKRLKAKPRVSFAIVTSVLAVVHPAHGLFGFRHQGVADVLADDFAGALKRRTIPLIACASPPCILLAFKSVCFLFGVFPDVLLRGGVAAHFSAACPCQGAAAEKYILGGICRASACMPDSPGRAAARDGAYYFHNVNALSSQPICSSFLPCPSPLSSASPQSCFPRPFLRLRPFLLAAQLVFKSPQRLCLSCCRLKSTVFYIASPRLCEMLLCYGLMFLLCGYFNLESKKNRVLTARALPFCVRAASCFICRRCIPS
jgi:hypothetical protein